MAQLRDENEIKIFILYLLDKIGYPLDYPSIGSIMVQDGIVNFFDFAECFFALVDNGQIKEIIIDEDGKESAPDDVDEDADDTDIRKTILYEVSDTGRQVARVLSDNLMVSVREKSYRSALRHLSFAQMGAYIDHSYEHEPNGDGYIVHCVIKNKTGDLMKLDLRADSLFQVDRMIRNFDDNPEVVFRGVVALVSGDVNYLFEQN